MSFMGKNIKRLMLAVSMLLFLLGAAILIIPFLVDVDQYRPEMIRAVNDRINGRLELGRLKLSLWGQIRVEVAGLKLQDLAGRSVVKVEDAFFYLPFSSIFSGSPTLTFKMKKPELVATKDKNGKINLLNLMKQSAAPAPAPAPALAPAPAPAPFKLPGLITHAHLGIEIREASFVYLDEAISKESQGIHDLNVLIRDFSLTRTVSLELWANLESKSDLSVQGPFRVTAQATPQLRENKLESLQVSFQADFDQVSIVLPRFFEKKKGIIAQASGVMHTSFKEAQIESLDLKFHQAELKASGRVTQMMTTPQVEFTIQSNEIALHPWSELVPMLKDYELGGGASFKATCSGEASQLNYQADLEIKKVTAKSPLLKTKPEINAKIKVITDQAEVLSFSMKAPGNDIQMSGKMTSFKAPKLELQFVSSGMDLDQLLDLPPLKKAQIKKTFFNEAWATDPHSIAKKISDFDLLFEPLRANKIARATFAQIGVGLSFIKIYGIKMTHLASKISMRELVATLDSFSMGLFGSAIKANASFDLKPQSPSYRFFAEANGLDLKQAVSSQFPLFKNTLLGTAFFKVNGTGMSLNPEPAKKNLNAKGNFKVIKATFATIDVGKMASEALNQTVSKLADQIPQLKGRTIDLGSGRESRYESILSDFLIAGGKFSAQNFIAKAEPKEGLDLKGNVIIGILDLSLKAEWEILDTYNFTHARDWSVEQLGVKVDHVLAEGDRPVRFPVHVNCSLTAPCYSYTEVPEFLGKVALNNITKAVEGRAKSELKKRAEEGAKKLLEQAPPALKNKAEDLKKKLFGR